MTNKSERPKPPIIIFYSHYPCSARERVHIFDPPLCLPAGRRVRGPRDPGAAGATAERTGAEANHGRAAVARAPHPVDQTLDPAHLHAPEDAHAEEGREGGGADTARRGGVHGEEGVHGDRGGGG